MKRWLSYVKPYTLYFILGPLLMIVEVIGEVLMPMYLGMILNEASKGTLNTPKCILYIIYMILTAVMMMVGGVGGAYYGTKASVNYAADIRRDVYKKVQKFSFANIDKFSTGSLVTRLTNDVTQIQNFVMTLLRMCMRSPGMFIGALIMAIRLRPQLSWIFAVSIPFIAIVITLIIKTAFPRFGIMQKKMDKLNSTVQESVTNVRVVKSFVREDYEIEKFTQANADLKNSGISAIKVMILTGPFMTLFMNVTIAAIIWFGAHQVMGVSDMMAPGDLSQFITYANQILHSLMMLSMMFMMSSRALASAKRVSEVLDEKVDIIDHIFHH